MASQFAPMLWPVHCVYRFDLSERRLQPETNGNYAQSASGAREPRKSPGASHSALLFAVSPLPHVYQGHISTHQESG